MLKNLVVTNIPKDIESLNKVLIVLRDHTWNQDEKQRFVDNVDASCIWYCAKYESYFAGNIVTHNASHDYKHFNEVVKI